MSKNLVQVDLDGVSGDRTWHHKLEKITFHTFSQLMTPQEIACEKYVL